jgi:hypothetical protein
MRGKTLDRRYCDTPGCLERDALEFFVQLMLPIQP